MRKGLVLDSVDEPPKAPKAPKAVKIQEISGNPEPKEAEEQQAHKIDYSDNLWANTTAEPQVISTDSGGGNATQGQSSFQTGQQADYMWDTQKDKNVQEGKVESYVAIQAFSQIKKDNEEKKVQLQVSRKTILGSKLKRIQRELRQLEEKLAQSKEKEESQKLENQISKVNSLHAKMASMLKQTQFGQNLA